MAEKGFGVKEINLIGASGTPTIESPNNLNLNAVNVAISTNATIGGNLTVTGTVGIAGTLTYEDVTNIDAVGIVTAREGVFIPDNKELKIGNTASSPDLKFYHNTHSYINNKTGNLRIESDSSNNNDIQILNNNTTSISNHSFSYSAKFINGGSVELYEAGNKKFETNNTGAEVTGTLTATTFSGSGASLTSLPAANLTGTLPAISGANLTNLPADTPTNSDIQVVYTVTANGSSAYRFGGNGIVSTEDNPDVYLIRGFKYRFINNSGGSHPFQIRQSSGGSAYSAGVTNNGASSGNIDFQVPYSAPSHLYYQCTSHGGMVGNLYIRGAGGQNTNVGITTFNASLVHVKSATPAIRIEGTSNAARDYDIKTDGNELYLEGVGGSSGSLQIGENGSYPARIDMGCGANLFYLNSNGNFLINGHTFYGTGTGGHVQIHDATLVLSKVGSGTRNWRFVNNNIAAGNLGLQCSTSDNGGTTYGNIIEITKNSDVTISASGTQMLPGATLNIISDKNAETGLDNKENYHLVLANPNNDTNESIGLAFGITDTTTKVGAAILHERDAAGSQGSLRFFTRPNNAGPPTEKVRIPATTWGLLVTNLSSTGNTGGYQTEGVSLRYDGDSTFVRTDSAAVTMTRKGNAGRALDFYSGTSFAGGIYVNGANSVQFQNSDYRLKTDVNSITDGIDKVKQLNPVYYKWKDTGDTVNTQNGFIAHEVQSVIPTLVFGEKDETIDEKGQGYQGLNYAGFTPTAIAAIKELIAKVETLEAKVTALEGS